LQLGFTSQFDNLILPVVPSTKSNETEACQKTQYANLTRYVPSGVFFARIRVKGKLIRKSLKTDVLSVAKLRQGDLEKSERQPAANNEAGRRWFRQTPDQSLPLGMHPQTPEHLAQPARYRRECFLGDKRKLSGHAPRRSLRTLRCQRFLLSLKDVNRAKPLPLFPLNGRSAKGFPSVQ